MSGSTTSRRVRNGSVIRRGAAVICTSRPRLGVYRQGQVSVGLDGVYKVAKRRAVSRAKVAGGPAQAVIIFTAC